MADEVKKEISHFYPAVCPQCGGRGCGNCGDFGLVYWYTDLGALAEDSQESRTATLFWGKPIDWPHIAERHLEKIVNKIINGLLVIFGIAGLILGAWAFGQAIEAHRIISLAFSPSFSWEFLGWPDLKGDWRIILFWLSLLVDLYVYYRLEQESHKIQPVLKRVFLEQAGAEIAEPLIPEWAELNAPKTERVDISRSYSAEAIKALEQAWRIAKNWHQAEVLPLHLLAGSFADQKLNIIFGRLGADWEKLAAAVKQALAQIPRTEAEPVLSLDLKNVLFRAYEQAYLSRQRQVTVAELIVAADEEKNLTSELLYQLGIEVDKVKNVVVWLQVNEKLREQWRRYHRLGSRRPKGEVNKAYTAVMTPFLDAFAVDLTRQAAYGAFPANVARDKEIEEIFRIIQGSGGSVVLVGLPGVGKTAILEEIAQRMIADEVPKNMQDKRFVSLSIPKLTAGAGVAEASERLLTIFNEINRAGNIILAIENVHNLVGISTGGAESLDLSEALSSYLLKTKITAITTTTPEDYNYLETNTTLGSHLQKVAINEPLGNQAIQILESRVGAIEYQNKVFFSYDAISQAVELSSRYVHDHYLPAKALDILREAAVDVAKKRGKNSLVLADDIAGIVSQKTNIPLTKISEQESEKLINLEDEIHQQMVDQEEAVKEVAAALRRARAGMRDAKRPIANFLFLGPTGVGKTELAKTIAKVYFGKEENMIRVDMSEYQTKESMYRLIGAPTGEKEGGYLTELVRHNPFSLLLFDEIEKAHPDILNLFLQVMDDGRLTDNAGRTIDFTSAIVIMTSNASTKYIQDETAAGTAIESIKKELIENRLGEYFRPEFLNRFDAINVFKPLGMDEVKQIARLMVNKVAKSLLIDGVALEVTEQAIADLAQAGFDPQFGARPLRRVVQERLSNSLANLKIQNQFKRGDKVIYGAGGEMKIEKVK